MKFKTLGIEWGPAYAEASPIRVSHGKASFETYTTAEHELAVELPTNAKLEWTPKGIVVVIPSDDFS